MICSLTANQFKMIRKIINKIWNLFKFKKKKKNKINFKIIKLKKL